MAPDALAEILDAVPAGRRQFLKTILTGTAFAAPLLASFSMDGVGVDAAAAGCLTPYNVSNMTITPFSCANGTVIPGEKFSCVMRDVEGKKRASCDFTFDELECSLEYQLKLTGQKRLVTVGYNEIGVPAAVLRIGPLSAEYVLSAGKGVIGTATPCAPSIFTVLSALRAGQAVVFVKTTQYEVSAPVEPE
jgi:hypothetical protein